MAAAAAAAGEEAAASAEAAPTALGGVGGYAAGDGAGDGAREGWRLSLGSLEEAQAFPTSVSGPGDGEAEETAAGPSRRVTRRRKKSKLRNSWVRWGSVYTEGCPEVSQPLQNQLRALADNMNEVLFSLRPQLLASQRLEAGLGSLRAQILRVAAGVDGGAAHNGSQDTLEVEASPYFPTARGCGVMTNKQEDPARGVANNNLVHFASPPQFFGQLAVPCGLQYSGGTVANVGDRNVGDELSTEGSCLIGVSQKGLARPAVENNKSMISFAGERRSHVGFVARRLQSRKPVLPDPTTTRLEVLKLATASRDVEAYRREGLCQKIATSDIFDVVTMLVIMLNAAWISIDADYNDATLLTDAHWIFIAVESAFTTFFLFEWLVRFGSFRDKRDCYRDSWFIFDSVMLALNIFETWILTIFVGILDVSFATNGSFLRLVRILRLCRIARLSKVLVCFPEVFMILKGLSVACRALVATLCFVGIVIYIFAIIFRQLARDTEMEPKLFPSIPDAMSLLLLTSMTPDLIDYFGEFASMPGYYSVLFFIFIMLVTFTTLNLLLGVMVNVVALVATSESEKMKMTMLRERMLQILMDADENGDQMISKDELDFILEKPDLCEVLQAAGITSPDLMEILRYILQEHKDEISMPQLLDVIWELRSSNHATMRDIVNFRRMLSLEFQRLGRRMSRLEREAGAATADYREASKRRL